MTAVVSIQSNLNNEIPFFSYKNFSSNLIKYEYVISGIATAVFSSSLLFATGGTVSIAFFGVRIIQGAVVCFLNHHFSNFGITIIKNSIGKIYSFFDDSVESIVTYKASIDTVRSTTFFKTIRVALNLFTTAFAFTLGTGSDALYLINLGLSIIPIAIGSFLLKINRVSEQTLTSYEYIKQREMQKQFDLAFQPRFNFSFPSFLRSLMGNIPGRVDENFQKSLNKYYEEKKQLGNSVEWIRKAITSYRISLGNNSRLREVFEEEYSLMNGNAFSAIAKETACQIINNTTLRLGYFEKSPVYPSIILKEDKEEFELIHKKYSLLCNDQKKEVLTLVNSNQDPNDCAAKEVCLSLRGFSEKKLARSPMFKTAILEIFSNRF